MTFLPSFQCCSSRSDTVGATGRMQRKGCVRAADRFISKLHKAGHECFKSSGLKQNREMRQIKAEREKYLKYGKNIFS